ncbi:Rid family hydrolase [Erythrobacter sp. YT30]|uniref:Rid family hydrolase n=1 Tax=Erythrobacter sp. YT30 TaxID=1735012 RepID=UPI000AB9AA98|nr:Rid family hydrolase [Erythrobacter sp. YT30]
MKHVTLASIAAFTLASTPALADDHAEAPSTEKQTIMPESEGGRAFMEEFGFSEAVIHGDTVYLSGVIAGPAPEGRTREEAYDRTFQYIGSVLERAGSSWDDVIDLTTYHVDIDASMPALAEVKNRYVKAPFPAWTAIDIDRLYSPDGEVEIKVTARLSPKPDLAFLPLEGSSTPFSEAVQAGDTLYLAGKLGTAADGSGLVPGGIEAETRRAMERIGETLAKYDLTHDAIVKCTVWLADIGDFAAFNSVYRTFFKEGRYPARSTMAVKDLAAGAAIEIECMAWNPQG